MISLDDAIQCHSPFYKTCQQFQWSPTARCSGYALRQENSSVVGLLSMCFQPSNNTNASFTGCSCKWKRKVILQSFHYVSPYCHFIAYLPARWHASTHTTSRRLPPTRPWPPLLDLSKGHTINSRGDHVIMTKGGFRASRKPPWLRAWNLHH